MSRSSTFVTYAEMPHRRPPKPGPCAAHRRSSEDIEWGDDDMLDAAVDYDYDEIMAGGR